MIRVNTVRPKKRGRPFTGGREPLTAFRMPDEMKAAIEAWASRQADEPGRSEAIRRLLSSHPELKRYLGDGK